MILQFSYSLADCELKFVGLNGQKQMGTGDCRFRINVFYQYFFTYLNFLMLASFGLMLVWICYRLVQFKCKRFQKSILQGMYICSLRISKQFAYMTLFTSQVQSLTLTIGVNWSGFTSFLASFHPLISWYYIYSVKTCCHLNSVIFLWNCQKSKLFRNFYY